MPPTFRVEKSKSIYFLEKSKSHLKCGLCCNFVNFANFANFGQNVCDKLFCNCWQFAVNFYHQTKLRSKYFYKKIRHILANAANYHVTDQPKQIITENYCEYFAAENSTPPPKLAKKSDKYLGNTYNQNTTKHIYFV